MPCPRAKTAMDISVIDAGPLRKQVTISFPADEVQHREGRQLGSYAGQAHLRGFRKGKAPKEILKKRYGETVHAEVVENMVNEALRKALEQHKLHPIGPFNTEASQLTGDVRHVVSFDVRPEISLPPDSALEIPRETPAVAPEELQSALDDLARRLGEEVAVADTLREGDQVILTGRLSSGETTVREIHDFRHPLGGYPLFGKPAAEVVALASTLGVGGVLAFETTLPANFRPEEWAGKPVRVEVTVQSATRQVPAVLDDAAARRVGMADVATLKQRMEQNLLSRQQQALHQRQVDALIDSLIARTDFALPPRLSETVMADQVAQRLRAQEQRGAFAKPDADREAARAAIEAELKPQVERWLRRLLLLDAIADRDGVKATRQDLDQQILMAAEQSGRKPQDIAKELQRSGRIMEVANEIRQAKALQGLLERLLAAVPA